MTYIVGQLFEWAGLLGSAGGPESTSTPFGIAVLLTPSFLPPHVPAEAARGMSDSAST